ncbi:hypothetical protein pipiens_005890 [Culex pipiens pipiens]|uniref:Uncharacterized protein n=1 Tax=Culex pipiens pipiens TaxID=38569 RepID=A0ABD1DUN7_CULPP
MCFVPLPTCVKLMGSDCGTPLSEPQIWIDQLRLPDFPVQYDGYQKQCGLPVRCAGYSKCPRVHAWSELERTAQVMASIEFEDNSAQAKDRCHLIQEGEFDFEMFFTEALDSDGEIAVKNTRTTEIFLQELSYQGTCAVKNFLEGRCSVNQSLSLEQCKRRKFYKCNPNYPYRSYNGICNNLQHAEWGQPGSPLKSEMAPCYDDYIGKDRRSASGRALPENRELMAQVQAALNVNADAEAPPPGLFNMFGVFFCEFINGDMLGRVMKRVRTATEGLRGCRADGRGVSRHKSALTEPLAISRADPNYGPQGVECLNFNPIESANDFCEVTYSRKRNSATSYLDLSHVYGDGKFDKHGKLQTGHCGASVETAKLHVIALQFLIVGGLFSQLHNYCVDQVMACGHHDLLENAVEKCRALTIGVYQRIVYEEVLPVLFGRSFYERCNFNCEYDPTLESVVSSSYINGPGRFQHIWIPENLTYVIMNVFYSKDGVRGHCLPCLDLERGRDAGTCPLLSYKHYMDKLNGIKSRKCYSNFEDLDDMFDPQLIAVLKAYYETPEDIDLLFSIFENQIPPGSQLPNLVAQSTCLEFKRLKCSDRFFYSWNPHLSNASRELIDVIDMKTLLALFGEIDQIPLVPFATHSQTVPASTLRKQLERRKNLFCSL